MYRGTINNDDNNDTNSSNSSHSHSNTHIHSHSNTILDSINNNSNNNLNELSNTTTTTGSTTTGTTRRKSHIASSIPLSNIKFKKFPEFDNSATIELRVRDLSKLEHSTHGINEPTIFVRRHTILVSLDPIKALIMYDRIVLIVPDGADELLHIFEKHMKEWVADKVDGITFELHAYEAILTTVKSLQQQEFDYIHSQVSVNLAHCKSGSMLSVQMQEQMRSVKNIISRVLTRLDAYIKALSDLIEDDEGMALMNLTKLKNNPLLYKSPLVPEVRLPLLILFTTTTAAVDIRLLLLLLLLLLLQLLITTTSPTTITTTTTTTIPLLPLHNLPSNTITTTNTTTTIY